MCSYINIYSKWIYFIREDPFVNKIKFWSSQFWITTSALSTMSERVSSSCFFLTCLLKFLFAENLLSHSSQDTSTCVVLCFWSPTIKEIGRVFKLLQEHFQMSMTLKMHIILHHYLDHFEVTGETLLKYTDEAVEAMHSQIKQFEERHHYTNYKYGSCSKAHSQHKSTVHINSLNLGDVKRKRK